MSEDSSSQTHTKFEYYCSAGSGIVVNFFLLFLFRNVATFSSFDFASVLLL